MSRRYDFWIHGVNTFIQSPSQNLGVVHKANKGTIVFLPAGRRPGRVRDWLHVAVPTPLCLRNDRPVVFKYLNFIAFLDGTYIDRLHIRCGGQLIAGENLEENPIYQRLTVGEGDLRPLRVDRYVHPDPPDPEVTTIGGGVVLCIRVGWDAIGSKIEVLGTGARFEA